MKKIVTLISFMLLSYTTDASEFQISAYPDTNKLDVTTISVADTISVTIDNLSAFEITGFYLTANTDDSVLLLETKIDGNVVPSIEYEIFDGTIYPNQLSTNFIVGNFTQSVSLKFYTFHSDNSVITFCGIQPFAFFGIAEPIVINCCVATRGNIDGDTQDNIDISDLVYLVDYSFGNPAGPAPICFEEADVDASGTLDISDMVLLVDFMFALESNVTPADCP